MSESHTPTGAAARLNTGVAHNARVWNYWIGGKDNYPVDQQVGEHIAAMFPVIREVARANRGFLARAVRFLAGERGMRQFLDLGTGLPTAENTHAIAQRIAPGARVVCVDNDPVVLMHARMLLTGTAEGATVFLDADVHDPDTVLEGAALTLDFTRPVAVMMLGILNFVMDTDKARDIVRRVMAAVPSGSLLALTHPTFDPGVGGVGQVPAMKFWNENAEPPITARGRADIASFLDGLDLVEPGLVSCSLWRPDTESPAVVPQFGAVAVKP